MDKDRIPSQKNDATKTMIALVANTKGGQTIVTAFLWQDDWYDIRIQCGEWRIDKLDMDRTKLFETRAEARASAGIAHIPDPKGKKKVTLAFEVIRLSRMIADPNQKQLTYPDDAVIEIGGDDNFGTESFRITYYEDDPMYVKQAKDVSASMAKVEVAAKTLEQAASAIKTNDQASIVPPHKSTEQEASLLRSVDRPIRSPKDLQDEVDFAKKSERHAAERREQENLSTFKKNIRAHIQRRLFEEQYHRFSARAEIVFRYKPPSFFRDELAPIEDCIFPWDAKSNAAFLEVIEEFKKAGWECSTSIGYESDVKTPVGFARLTLKINPSST